MGSYKNAGDILPPKLLRMVQAYAEGERLYVPVQGERRPWGEASGIRAELVKRNALIRKQYQSGHSLEELAEEHALSTETLRRIVRGCRRD